MASFLKELRDCSGARQASAGHPVSVAWLAHGNNVLATNDSGFRLCRCSLWSRTTVPCIGDRGHRCLKQERALAVLCKMAGHDEAELL